MYMKYLSRNRIQIGELFDEGYLKLMKLGKFQLQTHTKSNSEIRQNTGGFVHVGVFPVESCGVAICYGMWLGLGML